MLLTSALAWDLLVGFVWGGLISVVNHAYLKWVIRANANRPPQKATLAVVNAYFIRYFLDIGALALVYKHMWVLLGTAIGLMVMLKYSIIQQFIESKKHPYVSRRSRAMRVKPAPEAGIAERESPEERPRLGIPEIMVGIRKRKPER